MNTVYLRTARLKDFKFIYDSTYKLLVQHREYVNDYKMKLHPSKLDILFGILNEQYHIGYTTNMEDIGFIRIKKMLVRPNCYLEKNIFALIDMLYVKENRRRLGYGLQLIDYAHSLASEMKCSSVRIESFSKNWAATELYSKKFKTRYICWENTL